MKYTLIIYFFICLGCTVDKTSKAVYSYKCIADKTYQYDPIHIDHFIDSNLRIKVYTDYETSIIVDHWTIDSVIMGLANEFFGYDSPSTSGDFHIYGNFSDNRDSIYYMKYYQLSAGTRYTEYCNCVLE